MGHDELTKSINYQDNDSDDDSLAHKLKCQKHDKQ